MELLDAIRAGDDVSVLMNAPNVSLNAQDKDGNTALMLATQTNNVALMQQLLAAACDVNRRNQAGHTALFFASSVEAAELLVKKKININARDAQRSTAALRVIEAGHEDVAIYLIKCGCDVNERNKAQKTMLSAAIGKSQQRVIQALGTSGKLDWKAAEPAPLLFAAMTGNVNVAKLLLASPFNCDMDAPGPDGTTPLMAAIQNGHVALMMHLLKKDCNVDCRDKAGRSAWDYALERDPILAEALVESGYDLRRAGPNGQTALAVALAHKADAVAKLVVDKMVEKRLDLGALDHTGKSALWAAVLHGNTDLITRLLDEGCSARVTAKDGSTPLSLAIQHQKDDVVRLLLKDDDDASNVALVNAVVAGDMAMLDALLGYGGDVNATDGDGNTLLMLALRHRHEAMTNALLAKQCDTERCNVRGESALHMALTDDRVLALLLETSSAKLVGQDQSGKTLLMTALEGHATDDVLDRLLASFTRSAPTTLNATDMEGRTALFCAVETKRVEVAKRLLALGSNPNTQLATTGETVLLAAVRHEPSLVQPLLISRAKADLADHAGVTPLLLACAISTTPFDVVSALMKSNRNAQAATFHGGMTPLMLAMSHGRNDVMDLLLESKVDVTVAATDGRTALFLASTPELVQRLVNLGCSVDTKDALGRTPFMMAFDQSSDKVAFKLLELGCDVTIVSKEGVTALSRAVVSGSTDMVKRLLDAGCDINARDPTQQDNTPLMLALQKNRADTASLLLERGCDAVRSNKLGQSALFFASSVEEVATLLEKGCAVDDRDEDGQSPLMYHLRCNRPDVARVLMGKQCNLLHSNTRGESPLWYVVHVLPEAGAVAMATELLSHGVEKHHRDKTGDTALLHVLRHGLRDVAELLIKQEADVKVRNQNNESALHFVVDDVKWVQRLIKAGCHLNDQTHNTKKTPLMLALESKSSASAEKLLTTEGCDLRPADTTGATALFYIIRADAAALLKIMFDREIECDLNAQLHNGDTPLMEAIKKNKPDIAGLLLRHRCDVALLNNERASALDMLDASTSEAMQKLRGSLETTDLFFGDTFELHVQQTDGDVPLGFLPWRKGALVTDVSKQDVQYVLVVPGPEMLENNNTREAFIPARFLMSTDDKPHSSDVVAKEKKTVLKYGHPFVLQVAPETSAICFPTSQHLYSLNAKTPGSNHVLSLQPRFRDASAKVLSKGEMHVALTKDGQKNPVRNADGHIVVHVADANRLRTSLNTDWVTLPAVTRADGVVASPVCCDIAAGVLGLNGLLDRRNAKSVHFSIHKIDM